MPTPPPPDPPVVWSAPVRYAEVDAQGIVFNAHYLLYCDEALGAFCSSRGLREFAARVHLVTSTLTWTSPARWGEVIEVGAHCSRVGRTSAAVSFTISAGGRTCCVVDTVYVLADHAGVPQPITAETRAALTAPAARTELP